MHLRAWLHISVSVSVRFLGLLKKDDGSIGIPSFRRKMFWLELRSQGFLSVCAALHFWIRLWHWMQVYVGRKLDLAIDTYLFHVVFGGLPRPFSFALSLFCAPAVSLQCSWLHCRERTYDTIFEELCCSVVIFPYSLSLMWGLLVSFDRLV